jgi:hypothetical protein
MVDIHPVGEIKIVLTVRNQAEGTNFITRVDKTVTYTFTDNDFINYLHRIVCNGVVVTGSGHERSIVFRDLPFHYRLEDIVVSEFTFRVP